MNIQMRMAPKLRYICDMKYKKLLLLVSLVPLVSCSKTMESRVFYFDTLVTIKLYQGEQSDVGHIKEILKDVDQLADMYYPRAETNVYTINHTNEVVTVSERLYNMLYYAYDAHLNGATYYNPLCGSLSELWKTSLANKQVPSDEDIANEVSKIAASDLIFTDGDKVQRVGDATIDLGGVAKGYALDLVKDYLINTNIKQYLIDAGNSSILLGRKNTDSGYFNIGIGGINSYLKLKNCVVSTSSTSVQGVTIDEVTYSHIVNPVTGSAINNYDAVLVVSDSAFLGDALSTSMMMNTIEEIREIEEAQNVKTVVYKDGEKVYSHPDLKLYRR